MAARGTVRGWPGRGQNSAPRQPRSVCCSGAHQPRAALASSPRVPRPAPAHTLGMWFKFELLPGGRMGQAVGARRIAMAGMGAETGGTDAARRGGDGGRMPAIYLSHGAPPLADDTLWTGQLSGWSAEL